MEHDHYQGHNMQITSEPAVVDFGQIREASISERQWWRSVLKWGGRIVGSSIIFIILYIAFFFTTIKAIYDNGIAARTQLLEAQHVIINRDFARGAELVDEAHASLVIVEDKFHKLMLIRWIPYIERQVRAIDTLLAAGVNITALGRDLVLLGDELTRDIRNESLPFSKISDAKKREMLEKLVAAQPLLNQLRQEVSNARVAIDAIDKSKLVPSLESVIVDAQQYLPIVDDLLQQAVPMIDILPQVVGFDETKTYLFLLQNNYELRPTGGFIGTYGILKLRNGSIQQLITDNIYNLDRAFQDDTKTLPPQQVVNRSSPKPLQKYLEQRQLGLRDANWDPDFPSTARFVIDLYNQEVVAARDIEKQIFLRDPQNTESEFKSKFLAESFDGVIAMTPEIIENLLKITGPVIVDGIRFTDENFQDELSYRVTYEYRELDIDEQSRKDIIRRIADQITARITSLPYTRLLDVAQIMMESMQSKALLLYSTNDELQNMIIERGWAGEIRNDSIDYLFVVDTNLGSLKTDQFINRYVEYQIERQGSEYIATVTVRHEHTGEFAWNSTRLRSYTRVYVPRGAELLESRGAMYNDMTKNPENISGEVDVYEEHGKMVFGAFIATEPRETNELTFVYKLPPLVTEAIAEGRYNLLYQKQPGTSHYLTIDLDFDTSIRTSSPQGSIEGLFNDRYRYETPVTKDTWIVLGL